MRPALLLAALAGTAAIPVQLAPLPRMFAGRAEVSAPPFEVPIELHAAFSGAQSAPAPEVASSGGHDKTHDHHKASKSGTGHSKIGSGGKMASVAANTTGVANCTAGNTTGVGLFANSSAMAALVAARRRGTGSSYAGSGSGSGSGSDATSNDFTTGLKTGLATGMAAATATASITAATGLNDACGVTAAATAVTGGFTDAATGGFTGGAEATDGGDTTAEADETGGGDVTDAAITGGTDATDAAMTDGADATEAAMTDASEATAAG